MEYQINKNKVIYSAGRYFMDINNENLYQIIYDENRGYAWLNVKDGMLNSEFYETIGDLNKYTNITEMKALKQVIKAEFELTNEYD